MQKPDLLRECRERGLPVSGTRAHNISVLVREEGNGGGGKGKGEKGGKRLPGDKSKLEENI